MWIWVVFALTDPQQAARWTAQAESGGYGSSFPEAYLGSGMAYTNPQVRWIRWVILGGYIAWCGMPGDLKSWKGSWEAVWSSLLPQGGAMVSVSFWQMFA